MLIGESAALIDALRKGGFLDTDRWDELERDVRSAFPEARALARELVKRGWLTPFQANHLIQGRSQELLLGPYMLLERLAQGGSGPTFKALHGTDRRMVAVKFLARDLLTRPENLARFQEGVRAAALLSHPHLAVVGPPEQVGDTHFYTRQYIEGEDLQGLVARRGPLPVQVAAECVRQAALGLQHGFEHGVTHTGLQPNDILLVEPTGVIKLLGLGLARLEGAPLPHPDYLAPEQVGNPRVMEVRTNLFQLGRILNFLLTGQPLPATSGIKPGPSVPEDLSAVQPPGPEISAGLEAVLQKLTAPLPSDRYQTPLEVVRALEPFTKPVKIEPASGVLPPIDAGLTPAPEETAPESTVTSPAIVLERPIMAVAAVIPVPTPSAGRRAAWRWLASAAAGLIMLGGGSWYAFYTPNDEPPSGPAKHKQPMDLAPQRVELVTVLGGTAGRHWGPLQCVAWSRKAHLLASGGEDQVIRLWDPDTLEVRGVLAGQQATITCLVFTPDGRFLISGALNGTLWMWDVASGEHFADFVVGVDAIRAVAISPDGERAVSGGDDNQIRLWNVGTRRQLKHMGPGGNGQVTSIAFAPDGNRVLAGFSAGRAELWDIQTETKLATFAEPNGTVTAVAFSRQGSEVLTAGSDGTVRLWSVSPKPQKITRIAGPRIAATCVAFHPRERKAIAGYADGTLRIWDIRNGGEQGAAAERILAGHPGGVRAAVISPDGLRVFSGGRDVLVRLWSWKTGAELVRRPGHPSEVQSVALSADGWRVLSGGADNQLVLWNLGSRKPVYTRPASLGRVSIVAFVPQGKDALAIFGDGKGRIVNLKTGEARRNLDWKVAERLVNVVFTPAGDRVVTSEITNVNGSSYATVLRDTRKDGYIRGLTNHFQPVLCLAVSGDGKRLLSGGADSKIRQMDLATLKELRRLAGHTLPVLAVTFGADGHSALSVGADRSVWWWNLDREEDRRLADLPEPAAYVPGAVAFAQGGKLLAYGGTDGRLVVWNPAAGQTIGEVQVGGPVTRLVFSADGKYLATANGNGTVSVYRIGEAR
jgi:WD40 repeat protein